MQRPRVLDLGGQTLRLPARRVPGGAALPFHGGTVGLEESPFDPLRCGLSAQYDALISQHATERTPTHHKFIAQLLDRAAGEIATAQVVSVRQFQFTGHVYDLQTVNGWIIAQGIVSSNCRCAVSLERPGEAEE